MFIIIFDFIFIYIHNYINFFFNFIETVLSNVRNCPRSQALFYDQLTCIILQTQNINPKFIKYLTNYIEEEFINTNMINKSSYRYIIFYNL